jgi:hypothetical protein
MSLRKLPFYGAFASFCKPISLVIRVYFNSTYLTA